MNHPATLKHSTALITLLATILVVASCTPVNRTSTDSVDAKRAAIDGALKGMRTQKVDVFGESTEGGEAIAYKDATGAIRMIRMTHYGETGKNVRELYYEQSDLFLAELAHHRYNMPIYFTEEKIKEMGLDGAEVFDPSKTRTESYRYYFERGKVTTIIPPNNKPGSRGPHPDHDEAATMIELSKKLKKRLGGN